MQSRHTKATRNLAAVASGAKLLINLSLRRFQNLRVLLNLEVGAMLENFMGKIFQGKNTKRGWATGVENSSAPNELFSVNCKYFTQT